MAEIPTTDAPQIPNDDENPLAVRLAETETRLPRAGIAALALELGIKIETVRELRTDPAYLGAKEKQGLTPTEKQQLKTVAFNWMMECFAAPCDDATRLRIGTMVLAADFAGESFADLQQKIEERAFQEKNPDDMTLDEAMAILSSHGL